LVTNYNTPLQTYKEKAGAIKKAALAEAAARGKEKDDGMEEEEAPKKKGKKKVKGASTTGYQLYAQVIKDARGSCATITYQPCIVYLSFALRVIYTGNEARIASTVPYG